ncbi:MAG: WD40 repeat domain-containing protein, partial [Gemmataceae bacterium]
DLVRELAFSPDGRWLVAGMRGGRLLRWDLTRPDAAGVSWQGHDAEVGAVRFSADSRSLYSLAADRIRRWDAVTWEPAAAAEKTEGFFPGLTVTPDGSVACFDSGLRLLEGLSLKPTRPPIPIPDFRFFAVAGQCAVGGHGRDLIFYDLEHRYACQRLRRANGEASHEGEISDVAVHPAGDLVLTASADEKHVRLWQRGQGREVADLVLGGGTCRVAFSPDGRTFAVTGDKETRLYDVRAPVQETVGLSDAPLRAIALHPDGHSLGVAAAKADGHPSTEGWLWPGHGSGGRPLASFDMGNSYDPGAAQRFGFTPDGRQAVFSRNHPPRDCVCRLPIDGGPAAEFEFAREGADADLDIGPDGRLWVAGGERVAAVGLPGGKTAEYRNRSGFTGIGQLYSVAAGRRWVVAGGRDGILRVLPAAEGALTEAATDRLGTAPLRAVALSPDEAHALAGDDAGRVYHYRMPGHPDSGVLAGVAAHPDRVEKVCLTRSGLAASGSRDGTVVLWKADGLRPLLTLRLGRPVIGLGLFPDGARLAVLLKGERAARVWRLDLLRARCEEMRLGDG